MSVADFWKRNFVVVIGVALPTLLVLFLVVMRAVPINQIADPQYDLLFVTNNYGTSQLAFSVEGGRLKVRYVPLSKDVVRQAVRSEPELYYLDVDRLAVRRIPIELPITERGELASEAQIVEVPQLADLKLDPSSVAPDGYRFEVASSSGGLLTGLWTGRRHRHHALVNDGRHIKIPDTTYRYNTRLVGWVVGGELKD